MRIASNFIRPISSVFLVVLKFWVSGKNIWKKKKTEKFWRASLLTLNEFA
jgi:hypothetical protein